MKNEKHCYNCEHMESEIYLEPCRGCTIHRNETKEEFTKWEPATDSLGELSSKTLRALLRSQREAAKILIAENADLKNKLAEALNTRIK